MGRILDRIKRLLPEKIPAFGAVFYDSIPTRVFMPHYRMVAEEMSLGKNAVVLDIGTGPGILPLEIGKRFPDAKVIGMDISEKMVEIANKHKAKYGNPGNVEFTTMDANALKFSDNSLDMVVSTGSLHHWKDASRIFTEIYRCLKPGRQAWIYDGYGEATADDIRKSTAKLFLGFPPAGMVKRVLGFHGFSQKEYDTLIRAEVTKTPFKTYSFDVRGIMMRLTFQK